MSAGMSLSARLLPLLYRAGWWLALPVALLRLYWRGRREPGYRRQIGERLGRYDDTPLPAGRCLWVHAVSVGETRAAAPLIRALREADPAAWILLTHMTPTGRRTGAEVYAAEIAAGRLVQAYLPYDMPALIGRFLRRFRPAAGVLMETEVWPALLACAARARVPIILANARLSARSAARAARFGAAARAVFGQIDLVLAQTEADAGRLRALGAPEVVVCGNLKFDIAPDPALAARGERLHAACGGRLVVCAASTRDGEEALVLASWQGVLAHARRAGLPPPLLTIVPRHPQRFDEVAREVERALARGLVPTGSDADAPPSLLRRSALGAFDDAHPPVIPASAQVLLGDSMGEMAMYYAACDIAVIGGSLLPLGGQNLIEACAAGKPVLFGPHMFNFAQASADALAARAALRTDADSLEVTLFHLLADAAQRQQMGAAGRTFALAHQGAAVRMRDRILARLRTAS